MKTGVDCNVVGDRGLVRPHPGPLPQERGNLPPPSKNPKPLIVGAALNAEMDVQKAKAECRAPSPGGEGRGGGGSTITNPLSVIALVFSLALAGCGQKPSADKSAAEIRGEPIAPAPTKTAAPAALSSNAIPVAAAPSSPKPETRNSEPDFALAGFDLLSGYNIEISDELLGPVTNNLAEVSAKTEALIPPKVKALDKQRVALKGFMLPLKVEGGLVTEMLIMKDQSMCCYGTVPKIHEWVSIKMTEKGVKPLMDQAVTLYGKLFVGEMRENGYLTGIYRMDGEKMTAPAE